MAGDWIKMRADLFTHPKVVRISSALKADTLRTVGGLMSVWCLFDAHSEDGSLEGYTAETLDAHLRWGGFAAAMIAVGWLVDNSGSLSLPRFDTHNGQSAKRRAQDADRKKNVRKASAPEADNMRTREEKRREEEKREKRTRKKSPEVTLADWVAGLGGADAIPADDPIFDWAEKVGLPRGWIAAAWWVFEGRYTEGKGAAKTYADWRATFRLAVREDWLKLWRLGADGYFLTTAGQQAMREMGA